MSVCGKVKKCLVNEGGKEGLRGGNGIVYTV